MQLRVAHIISGLTIGGAERHLVNLLNAMDCEYRAAIFLGPKTQGPSFHKDLDAQVGQHFVRIRRRSLPFGIAKLASVLKKNRINVVHAHMFHSSLYGALAVRLAGVPVMVTTEHGENPWKTPLSRWLERHVISPSADLRLCVSPQILALRRDLDGVSGEKLKLIVNGTLVPPMRAVQTPKNEPLIGAVGRFISAKDYPRLLEAFADLRRRGYRATLCIVGDGPEMENVKATIKRLELEDLVSLPGLVADIDRWYERFDVCVSSSIREGQPVAVLEAMAHGLPVVATDVGATAETVRHGDGGLIVPPADATALADAIGTLLDDAGLREMLGRNARARIEREYSVKAVSDLHIKYYRELLSTALAS